MAIAFLGIYSKELKADTHRYIYICVHSSVIHNSQKIETTHIPINRWMGKQNGIHTHNGLLFIFKKEWSSNTCYNMLYEFWKPARRNKPHKKTLLLCGSTYEVPKTGKFIENGSRGDNQEMGGGEDGVLFIGCRVSIWYDERVLEMDSGRLLLNIVNVLDATETYTWKWLK